MSSSNRSVTSPAASAPASRAEGCSAGAAWRRWSAGAFAGIVTVGLLLTGCSGAQLNQAVVKLFEPRKTPQQHMYAAFASEDADERRSALAKVARSKQRDRSWAIQGYVAIALLDDQPQARCVAIRALAGTGDPAATETALKILNYREHPPAEVRPPDDLTRWDTVEALADLATAGKVPTEHQERVRQTLLDRLRLDTHRHARIAAARGLGNYRDSEVVHALVERLSDEDFAVVHECESALVRLTGRTHYCDALAWKEWLAANESDLFAGAGQIPASRRPPYRNRFEKFGYDARQFLNWLVPGRKER